jgi:xanthine dehydrogenase YagS FAD-binding subunit
MSGFLYERPSTLDAALAAIASPGAVPIGGGTDLLVWIDEGLSAPERVVDLRGLEGGAAITDERGGVRIGAGAAIADIAAHALVRQRFPVLADACASVGTPALRNMGTLGGNLAQRPRCWYLRRNVRCFKNGGDRCAAVEGEHQYHAIATDGTCHAVHPSDPAVALAALGAEVEVSGPRGSRRVAMERLYEGAASNRVREATLADDEIITAVLLDAAPAIAGGRQHWEKLMQRGAWDFALVSCAGVRRADGAVRIFLGGVALGPWRIADSVEEDVSSGGLDDDSIDALAERAMYDVRPLPGTAYKVSMAQAALRRAMRALAADG